MDQGAGTLLWICRRLDTARRSEASGAQGIGGLSHSRAVAIPTTPTTAIDRRVAGLAGRHLATRSGGAGHPAAFASVELVSYTAAARPPIAAPIISPRRCIRESRTKSPFVRLSRTQRLNRRNHSPGRRTCVVATVPTIRQSRRMVHARPRYPRRWLTRTESAPTLLFDQASQGGPAGKIRRPAYWTSRDTCKDLAGASSRWCR